MLLILMFSLFSNQRSYHRDNLSVSSILYFTKNGLSKRITTKVSRSVIDTSRVRLVVKASTLYHINVQLCTYLHKNIEFTYRNLKSVKDSNSIFSNPISCVYIYIYMYDNTLGIKGELKSIQCFYSRVSFKT